MSTTTKKVKRELKNLKDEDSNHPAPTELSPLLERENEVSTYKCFPADNVRELWLNIFEKMEPQDKFTFSRACPSWHDWIAPKRTQLHFLEIVPTLLELRPNKSICQFRQLNKNWTEELDNQIVSLPYQLQLETETIFHYGSYLQQICKTKLQNLKDVQTFIEQLERHSGKPFPSRSIHLQFLWEESNEKILCGDYWNNVISLLNQFGRNVLCLSIDFQGSTHIGIDNLENLRNILLQTPNLRRLNLVHETEITHDDIREFYAQNSLPQLANLESLQIYDVEGSLIDIILNSCCIPANIKHLYIYDLYGSRLPEVANTFLNLDVLISSACTLEDLARLGNLEEKPPLREISLGHDYINWRALDRSISYIQVFTSLEAFGNTLVHLELHNWIFVPNYAEMTFNLPNLKSLKFICYDGSFDPLLNFRKLSHLSIMNYSMMRKDIDDGSKSHLVDILECGERIEESNIWRKMPSLNYFQYKEIKCRRQVFKNAENDEFEYRILKEEPKY